MLTICIYDKPEKKNQSTMLYTRLVFLGVGAVASFEYNSAVTPRQKAAKPRIALGCFNDRRLEKTRARLIFFLSFVSTN